MKQVVLRPRELAAAASVHAAFFLGQIADLRDAIQVAECLRLTNTNT